MTEGKKFKKRVRERAARTGERYQAAHRNSQEPFARLVRDVIEYLDPIERSEQAEHATDGPKVYTAGELVREYFDRVTEFSPVGVYPLWEKLKSVSDVHLTGLVALMYSGRDDDDFSDTCRDWRNHSRVVLERVLNGKGRVAEYLQRGVARASRSGIDLDATLGQYGTRTK